MEEFSIKALFAKINKTEKLETFVESYKKAPIQLIKVKKNGKLKLSAEGEDFLKQIPGKIAPIGVCGPLRTGKSSLMNLLVSDTGSGFRLSHNSENKTEGIWVWGEPMKTKSNTIIFLDCEATKSVEASTASDTKVLALAVLLSSIILFNSRGAIDQNSIHQLALATCFSDIIDFRYEFANSPEEINQRVNKEAPKFVWVLRDINPYVIEDAENNETFRDYMENILSMPNFMGKDKKKTSEIRDSLVNTFKERDCVGLPMPFNAESDSKNFEALTLLDLKDKFVLEFEKFKLNLLELCPTKKINGTEVSGYQLSELIKQIISEMNNGEVPNLYNNWDFALHLQYDEVLIKAKEKYLKSKKIDPAEMPYEEKELLEILQTAKDDGLALFTQICDRESDLDVEVLEKFQEFYQEDFKMTLNSNLMASEAYNLSLIESLYRPIINKIDEGYYLGEFEEMESDWIKAMREYEKTAKGPGKFIAISEFSRMHQHSAFNKFFQAVLDQYQGELHELRSKDKEYMEMLQNHIEQESRKKIIDDHVKCIQVNELKSKLNLDDDQLKSLFEKIEKNVQVKL